MGQKSVYTYYAGELRTVLRRPASLLSFAAASAMHAVGHALVALVAGGVAVALADGWRLGDARSTPLAPHVGLAEKAFFLSLVGLVVVVVKAAAGVYATFVQARVAGEVGGALRLKLLDALLSVIHLRRPRHEDQGVAPTALAVAALTERVRDVEVGLAGGLLGGARAAAQLVPIGAVLVVLSPKMAGVAACVLGLFGVALGRVRSAYARATTREASERAALLGAADEAVRHADLWVTYGAQERARSHVRGLGDAIARGAASLAAKASALSGGNEVLGAAALVAAVAASRAGWLGAVADGPTLLAFAVAFFLAYRPMRELAEARLALARAQGAYDELAGVIESARSGVPERGPAAAAAAGAGAAAPGSAAAPASAVAPPRDEPWETGTLELRGLRLAHGECGAVSAKIPAGSIAVVVGPTGVGKTTLLRTMLGLERAAAGEVVYAGVELGDAPAGPASRPFAWVPQDAPLLADTLDANVALGASSARAAAGTSGGGTRGALGPIGAGHLVDRLRSARLGAGGRAVSGGERQWIALARAIATGLPVLLLDEPTSGLDADAQRRVLEAIERLRGERTVVLVTHRREPMAIADVVLRLDPGDPIERAA
jgi:ABC-type multidrug transport system fused ATPase/permease subunit